MEIALKHEKVAEIPAVNDFAKLFFFLKDNDINWRYFKYFRDISTLNDEITSTWLNINSKTLRTYRKPESNSKDNIKEHLVLLISLYKHGIEVFGNTEAFDQWLLSENKFLDNQAPKDFLGTITGIKFVDTRLTALEYGDNV
ncbi:hypothetical protein BCY91_09465 [Pelobium manganitolerans]|uniref:Antitoxin Xre/MbcA/ParS-like toxin-binding domain-containing protein n=1 Tax=Pelobium manganitolerans TaxID=1842495 RepID=A0A419S3M4_9SPHI|nr:MbcA/ParS/Xre antitoxin family protein [Pelobium manganitolerans]RKD13780.1 hypothetical protein BCY91_09465 [Pelobium manganitolerans]